VTGPAYETASEVEFLRQVGATVVTMSAAPELAAAARMGLRTAAVAVVTNLATGSLPADHREVLEAASAAVPSLRLLVEEAVAKAASITG